MCCRLPLHTCFYLLPSAISTCRYQLPHKVTHSKPLPTPPCCCHLWPTTSSQSVSCCPLPPYCQMQPGSSSQPKLLLLYPIRMLVEPGKAPSRQPMDGARTRHVRNTRSEAWMPRSLHNSSRHNGKAVRRRRSVANRVARLREKATSNATDK